MRVHMLGNRGCDYFQWVVKTRMCLQVNTAGGTAGNYNSVGHALRTILQTEGVAGLYAGLLPGLFGTLHGAVQFMVYEVGLKTPAYCSRVHQQRR